MENLMTNIAVGSSIVDMPPEGLFPDGRRYNSYVGYFRRRYGARLQKVVIDAGFTCPNRDGFLSHGGCTFCDNAAFHPAYSCASKPIAEQIDEGVEFHRGRYRNTTAYLAYFQSYSNTYAPLERLKEVYLQALAHPSVVGIVIGTRPDCVDEEKLDFLRDLSEGKVLDGWSREMPLSAKSAEGELLRFERPVVIVEYGIESCYDKTLRRVNRGHDFASARKAVEMTAERGLECGAHFILGLPGESREMMLEECGLIDSLPLTTVKFHQLQIVRGTAMETEFARCPQDFERFTLEEYVDFFVDMLERLRPELCIERFAGEVPPRFVNGTPWGLVRNVELLRMLEGRLFARATWQGRRVRSGGLTALSGLSKSSRP